jgi:hypothetical protein
MQHLGSKWADLHAEAELLEVGLYKLHPADHIA